MDATRDAAAELIRDGLIQAVSTKDFLNPHIRPWQSRRSIEDQTDEIRALTPESDTVCLYPTKLGMKGVRLPKRLMERPFERMMAKGQGTLELAFFQMDVLEAYRNDSRYDFQFGDAGAHMHVSDEAYLDTDEPSHDKVSLSHIGFAYDFETLDFEDSDSPIIRRVAVFLGDLAKLSPQHQQRWNTYRVNEPNLHPHPLWWGQQMGEWADGVGPFGRLFIELRNINELTTNAFGSAMFASIKRPEDLGWLLRPSSKEWDGFISLLDKILSENLRKAFFDEAEIPSQDNGQPIGTLNRLRLFMCAHGVSQENSLSALKPLKDIRKARQRPAHALNKNITDRTFIRRQITLLHDVNETLVSIRKWLATHPANHHWESRFANLKDYAF